jgi:hypothetical protein
VTDGLDGILFQEIERWWDANRASLAAGGTVAVLQGPFEAVGMDPVYIVRLDSGHREAEAHLFRGGILLLYSLGRNEPVGVENDAVDITSAGELTETLDRFAWPPWPTA